MAEGVEQTVFKGHFHPKPFCDSMFSYPGRAERSQGVSAELAYLVSVSMWGKSQPSCLTSGLSWKRESRAHSLEHGSPWGLQEL